MRVAVDTSVWISALLNPNGAPAQVLTAWRERRFTVVASAPVIAELERVLMKPRIARKYVLPPGVLDLATDLRRRADLVHLEGSVQLCRDPRDDMFIETAQRGKATILVSRDEDFTRDLELHQRLNELGIRAMSVRQFLLALDEEGH